MLAESIDNISGLGVLGVDFGILCFCYKEGQLAGLDVVKSTDFE